MPIVSGRVVDREGRPVSGVRIFFSRGPGAYADVVLLSGDQGEYTMAAPNEGEYEITAVADEQGSAKQTLEVTGDGARDVELRLDQSR